VGAFVQAASVVAGVAGGLTTGSLFAGVDMMGLAVENLGGRVLWHSETDDYASRVLAKRWPGVPNLGDVRDMHRAARVDLLTGGFPCQDLSVAGLGAGLDGARSGLWAQFARIIAGLRPRAVLIENVPVLRSRGMVRVLRDLWRAGYVAEWDCIPAAAVGAPHLRDRVWICAYRDAVVLPDGKPVANVEKLPRAGVMLRSGLREVEPEATVRAAKAALPAGLWPTVRATDGDRGGRGDLIQAIRGNASPSGHFHFPTPNARDWKDTMGPGRMGRGQLPEAVRDRMWPTPRSSWNENRTTQPAPSHGNGHGRVLAGEVMATTPGGGRLSSDWTEWLMGMPVGWTDLECDEPAQYDWSAEPVPRTVPRDPLIRPRLTCIGNSLVWQVAATRVLRIMERIA
jgi:site-specific DNA-cytosine methylase